MEQVGSEGDTLIALSIVINKIGGCCYMTYNEVEPENKNKYYEGDLKGNEVKTINILKFKDLSHGFEFMDNLRKENNSDFSGTREKSDMEDVYRLRKRKMAAGLLPSTGILTHILGSYLKREMPNEDIIKRHYGRNSEELGLIHV